MPCDLPRFSERSKSARNSPFARSSTALRLAGKFLPARLMYRLSIDMAERFGVDFRRLLRSADRLSDRAIFFGSLCVKTPRSKSIALLCCVTYWDHFFFMLSIFPDERTEITGEPRRTHVMADSPLTFAAYAGSLRKNSYNKLLLHALVKLAPPHVTIETLDITDVPLFNMDFERNPPAAVTRMREKIRAADGLIIVSPEHNGIIPAVTKTVIEWASRPPEDSVLEGKPAAVLGGSTGYFGTAKAQVVIRQIATAEGLFFLQDPEVRVARVNTKFNEKGELIDDELAQTLVEFLEAMALWTRTIASRS